MGLKVDIGIVDIIKEGLRNSFKNKSVLMLGKQDMHITIDELFKIARSLQYNLSEIDEVNVDRNGFIDSYSFFSLLGFQEVKALDVSDYENADYIFDLNNNELPQNLINRFDYIIDGGTFEHLFNINNAFENIIKILKVGGKIFHYVPVNNFIDHGFYSFSPVLFIEYYNENKFFIEDVSLIYSAEDDRNSLTTKIDCRLIDFINKYKPQITSNDEVYLQCIVKKESNSTYGKIPIQKKFFVAQQIKEKAINKLNEIKDEYPEKSIAIYGAGDMANRIIKYMDNLQDGSIEKIFGLIDKNEEQFGKIKYGFEIFDIDKVKNKNIKAIIIASSTNEEEIYYRIKHLKKYGIDIIKLIN